MPRAAMEEWAVIRPERGLVPGESAVNITRPGRTVQLSEPYIVQVLQERNDQLLVTSTVKSPLLVENFMR